MKKIEAYAGDCVSDNLKVIVDDYPNKEGNSELAINLDIGDSLLSFYREIKKGGSVEYVVINVDKNSKKLTRYIAQETNHTVISSDFIAGLVKVFGSVQKD